MEEGREGNTIIRIQYSTTCVEMRGTPVRRVLVVGRQAGSNENGANLQHVKRGAQEGGRRRVFIPP
jgi:hypothetical protein